MDVNRRSREGLTIDHGQRCWCIDHRGRILRGVAYYDLNNNWRMRLSQSDDIVVRASDIFVRQPDQIRLRRNADRRAWRLKQELERAVKAEDFRRAHLLKGLRDAMKPRLAA